MARYRKALPQLAAPFITDGGIETELIFRRGLELPEFAAFVCLPERAEMLREYYREYVKLAGARGCGVVLETATWRASRDWGAKIDAARYTPEALDAINQQGVRLLEELRGEFEGVPVVISGCLGPRADGYRPDSFMTVAEARAYHEPQLAALAASAADLATAATLTYAEEAAGIALACNALGLPVCISFTLETDGRLPSGMSLAEAVSFIKAQGATVASFGINCVHPEHFAWLYQDALHREAMREVKMLKVNASSKSHTELDGCPELDAGDPPALCALLKQVMAQSAAITVLGGCCGTNHVHIDLMAALHQELAAAEL